MASSNTARALIKGAIRLIKGTRYKPSNAELGTGLTALNDLLASWSADQISVPVVISETFPTVIGQVSYTIGSGGDISTVRPTEIKRGVFIRDSGDLDHSVVTMTREQYRSIADKTVSARPSRIYYEPSYPLAVIYFNFAPSDVETVHYDSLKPLTEILNANVDTVLSLPPEYKAALRYNLALQLAPEYGDIQIPELVIKGASESKSAVERVNALSPEQSTFDNVLLARRRGVDRTFIETGR